MKPKEEILNEIIEKNGYKSYLEIGTQTNANFDKINIKSKTGIDPKAKGKGLIKKTSDDFFKDNDKTFDLVFIDGFHHADQVRKDIVNSMRFLEEDGAIVLHDTIPHNKAMQEVPRKQKEWTGDVWRAAVGFHKEYPDIPLETLKADYGLTFIYPQGKKYRKHFEDMETTFAEFDKNKTELLNIID